MTKIAGSGSESGSGSISQRHGSADPDTDPHQIFMYPQHWFRQYYTVQFELSPLVEKCEQSLVSSVSVSNCISFYATAHRINADRSPLSYFI
jgi:hypothetical protein